jgi:hypothetical protein
MSLLSRLATSVFLLLGAFAHGAHAVGESAEIWWVHPPEAAAGSVLRLFGRGFTTGRGKAAAALYLEPVNDGPGRWIDAEIESRYVLTAVLPRDLRPGGYRVRTASASHGCSTPMALQVRDSPVRTPLIVNANSTAELQPALEMLRAEGGGTLVLAPIAYRLSEPLRVPSGVTIAGAGPGKTILQVLGSALPIPGLVKPGGPLPQIMRLPDPVPGQSGGAATAAVLMFDSDSAIRNLSIQGNGTIDQGIAVAGTAVRPVRRILIEGVHIHGLAPFQSLHGQTQAILVRHGRDVTVRGSELQGNGPALYLEDVAESAFISNKLSGQGEGVISGREGGVRRSLIENNHFLSRDDGAPQAIRAVWLSTLFGSTYHNYIAHNRGANFHAPPGTDQNRGEAILLETALTHPYFGAPEGAALQTVVLPQAGVDWSLLTSDLAKRATLLEDYFVVVVDGKGRGQARRIVGRDGRALALECPWRDAPDETSIVVISELNYRNLIVGNELTNALAGIQLWINGVENVIALNRLRRFDREGILLFADAVGGPQSVKPYWPPHSNHLAGFNRGIGVSYLNHVENNSIHDANTGIDIAVGDFRGNTGPIPWPLSMGNEVRGNLIQGSRIAAIRTGARYPVRNSIVDIAPSLVGNVFHNNQVIETR